jgi:hypothetical protein
MQSSVHMYEGNVAIPHNVYLYTVVTKMTLYIKSLLLQIMNQTHPYR